MHVSILSLSLRLSPNQSIYGLLMTYEVKMDGYWPSSFLACYESQGP